MFAPKRKLKFLPTAFAVILSAVAFLVVIIQKFQLNFEVLLCINLFCFVKAWEAALNPRSVFKTHLTEHRLCSFKSIRVTTFWPQNYSFDSFLVQAGHPVLKDITRKIKDKLPQQLVEKTLTQTA